MAGPCAGLGPGALRALAVQRGGTCWHPAHRGQDVNPTLPTPCRHSPAWRLLHLFSLAAALLMTHSAAEVLQQATSPLAAVASSSSPRSPIESPQQQQQLTSAPADYYSSLVTLSSHIFGEVTKAGPLPVERYDDKLFNHTAFREWLLRRDVYREDPPGPPPMSYRCGVFVNHHYKLIFIRNRKAASTTVLDTFKAACKSTPHMCMRAFSREEMAERGLSHDHMWRSYYVISSTRNPWARAASGYDYTQDRWPLKTGVCGPVSFPHFCTDPYLMGKLSNLFRCGTTGSFRGDDAWAYDFYHIEPAHHCMTDATGKGLSVDFLIRYEHLHEDFSALVDILNRRRDPSLPEIRGGKMRWRKQGVHVQAARNQTAADGGGGPMWHEDKAALVSSDRHAVRYRQCGMTCVNGIAEFFKEDLRLMQIKVPPPLSSDAAAVGR